MKSMQHVVIALHYNKKNHLATAFTFLQFHSWDAHFAWVHGAVARLPSPSARHWVRWATFRKLKSRMGKSGYVNHVRN